MNTRLDNFVPDISKLYTIRHHNKNYQNLYNAIFGRANKPYPFAFLKIAENHYLLSRYEDNQILCFDHNGELKMSGGSTDFSALIVNPMKGKQEAYALSIKNQQLQGYICYDGLVLHEYYIKWKATTSINEAAIWSISEVPNAQLSSAETSNIKNCKHFALN